MKSDREVLDDLFIVTLDLKDVRGEAAVQELGTYDSLTRAKTGAQRDHRAFSRLENPREAKRVFKD